MDDKSFDYSRTVHTYQTGNIPCLVLCFFFLFLLFYINVNIYHFTGITPIHQCNEVKANYKDLLKLGICKNDQPNDSTTDCYTRMSLTFQAKRIDIVKPLKDQFTITEDHINKLYEEIENK